MLFETSKLYVDSVMSKDIHAIVKVYNSNTIFLKAHMDRETVTDKWMAQELVSMRQASFKSCKISKKTSGQIIGEMEFRVGTETYLSLLMIHNQYKNKGIGRLIFQAFKTYARQCDSKSIRIDVVTDYSRRVFDFWIHNGFTECGNVELNWTGKILPAVVMRTCL